MSETEIAALKLICWCQCAQRKDLLTLLSEDELDNLVELFLLSQNEKTSIISLTSKGYEFLNAIQSTTLPSHQKCYTKSTVQRRLRISTLVLTAFRASVNIFTTSLDDLSASPSLILTSRGRTDAQNPWGSCRAAAIVHLGNLLSVIHYVCPGIGKIALEDEMKSFNNQASKFRGLGKSMIFAGESYQDILKELETECDNPEQSFFTYGEVYRQMRIPICLLSCDDTGAMQLMLMTIPEYRTVIARALMEDSYTKPEVSSWDFFYGGRPYVVSVDMDLHRIDKAIASAAERKCGKVILLALENQAASVLLDRYQRNEKADVLILEPDLLRTVLGEDHRLYSPAHTQFLTEKGDVINAPSIRAARKAGGYHHS